MLKQIIVVRTELGMSVGKIATQCSHASMKVFLDRMKVISSYTDNQPIKFHQTINSNFTPAMLEWLNWEEGKPGFTKIVLGVETEKEIYDLADKAKEANIPYAVIVDNGMTEFAGNKTTTCIALGPADSDHLDPITGRLKLL